MSFAVSAGRLLLRRDLDLLSAKLSSEDSYSGEMLRDPGRVGQVSLAKGLTRARCSAVSVLHSLLCFGNPGDMRFALTVHKKTPRLRNVSACP